MLGQQKRLLQVHPQPRWLLSPPRVRRRSVEVAVVANKGLVRPRSLGRFSFATSIINSGKQLENVTRLLRAKQLLIIFIYDEYIQ